MTPQGNAAVSGNTLRLTTTVIQQKSQRQPINPENYEKVKVLCMADLVVPFKSLVFLFSMK